MNEPLHLSQTQATPRVSGSDELATVLLRARALDAPPRPGLIGAVDRFEVLGVIGQGGMGVVLLAREPETDTKVAIKMLRPEVARDASLVKRFLTEARHMYKLDHPCILRVLEVSAREAGPYYVMPFKERGPLSKMIEPGKPLDNETALSVARSVAEALAHAHAQGLIHRDVKPQNVLIEPDGRAVLADFGLVRTVFNDSIVEPGREGRLGTVAYMSPAVARGEAEDTRCDIYSFGALLYEMLTGEPPYSGQSREIVLNAILAGPPVAIAKRNPKAHPGLVKIAEGCMARELRERYASMADVVRDLEREANRQESFGPRGVGRRRVPVRAIAKAALMLLIIAAAGLRYGPRLWNRVANSGNSASANTGVDVFRDRARQVLSLPVDMLVPAQKSDTPQIVAARNALIAAPSNSSLISPLFWACLRAGRSTEALSTALRGVGLRPDDSDSWADLGQALTAVGNCDSALVATAEALRLKPGSAQAYYTEAYAHQMKGEHEQAIIAFRHCLKTWPRNGDALICAAHSLNELRQFAEAESFGRDALSGHFGYPEDTVLAWRVIGESLFGQGKIPEAADAFERVERERPDRVPPDRKPHVLRARAGIPTSESADLQTVNLDLGGGVAMEFVLIPAGEFTMGSPRTEPGHESNEVGQHRVFISNPFLMGRTEITQKQWQQLMGANPSRFNGDDLPVDRVCWDDCIKFCAKASTVAGRTIRLPTEAEWEYACRAGGTGAWCFGDEVDLLSQYAWHSVNETHRVGSKAHNAWGLFDMHGNVWEWTQDRHSDYPTSPQTDPRGPDEGMLRVIRGGSWSCVPESCRSARRGGYPSDYRADVGLRVVAEVSAPDVVAAQEERLAAPGLPTKSLDLGDGLKMDLVLIPAGEFMMGSAKEEDGHVPDEAPQHLERIDRPFFFGRTEATNGQFRRFRADHASLDVLNGERQPAIDVSWDEANEFCEWLGKRSGRTIRLPTEAEWEHACRAGSTTRFCFGDSNSDFRKYAWCLENAMDRTHDVGTKPANAWRLFDMHGNVKEWCQDRFQPYPDGSDESEDPVDSATENSRVVRGGSYGDDPRFSRSAKRIGAPRNRREPSVGFRVVAELTDEELDAAEKARGAATSQVAAKGSPTTLPDERHVLLELPMNGDLAGRWGQSPAQAIGVVFEPGVSGLGARFPAGNQVFFPSDGNINPTEGTLEFWIKPNWMGNDGVSHAILKLGDEGGIAFSKDGANYLRAVFNRYGTEGKSEYGPATNAIGWLAHQWRYVAFTWSKTTGLSRIYVDSTLVASAPLVTELPIVKSNSLQIGADGPDAPLDAVLDELRISDVARSEAEILQRFQQSRGGK